MTPRDRKIALAIAKKLISKEEYEKILTMPVKDLGFGFDPFGMERESAILAYAVIQYVYKFWFRVVSEGHHNIPEQGRALICPNHSGVLPLDGAMIGIDLIKKMDKPRMMRAVVDNFMGFLPYISTFLYRCGQVVGARRNFRDLLENDELVCVFPEGAKGTGKLFKHRYNLVRFNVGFIELSLLYKAPIIPTAVIGGEEQFPMFYDVKWIARALNFPYFPITAQFPFLGPLGLLPFPSQYHIYFGEPIRFFEEYPPETVNDPPTVRMLADKVQVTVQRMVNEGLTKREGFFDFKFEDGELLE